MLVCVSRNDANRRDPVMRRRLPNVMLREASVRVHPVNRTFYKFRDRALARIVAIAGSTILLCTTFMFSQSAGRTAGASSERAIDTERSAVTVRVYKSGLFSSFGHDHEILAPIKDGAFDEEKSTLWFFVEGRSLPVRHCGASENDPAE